MEQGLAVAHAGDEIDSEPFCCIASQGRSRGDNRTLVDQNLLERRALDPLGKILVCGVKSIQQRFRPEIEQQRRVLREVEDNDAVPVARVGGNRHHQTGIAVIAAVHPRRMQDRRHLLQVDVLEDFLLTPQAVEKIIELGLLILDQFRERNGGIDVGQGVMCLFMGNAIRNGEFLESEAGPIGIRAARPDNVLGAQIMAGAHHIDDIPARIAVLPLATVGIVQVAVEGVARHLIIEAQ